MWTSIIFTGVEQVWQQCGGNPLSAYGNMVDNWLFWASSSGSHSAQDFLVPWLSCVETVMRTGPINEVYGRVEFLFLIQYCVFTNILPAMTAQWWQMTNVRQLKGLPDPVEQDQARKSLYQSLCHAWTICDPFKPMSNKLLGTKLLAPSRLKCSLLIVSSQSFPIASSQEAS